MNAMKLGCLLQMQMSSWRMFGWSLMIGAAVVTRADGRLALGKLRALMSSPIGQYSCSFAVSLKPMKFTVLCLWMLRLQLKDLNTQGFEVILVTLGAVGAGRQKLRYRKLLNYSFADLQKPQAELDG
ncbi:hypothetical protein MKW98_009598 [Papaver atlanticum]|uniref:Uncharacterized protein n=1 Tax=Papaver atlanticum TaxID=357466 RepID=A0AAD4SCT1_9MAGN|nr:hypothetical protein MKW98_009598 [Papaver atlanticum]